MVGILEKSLYIDFSEIENAAYNLDTSVISLEALQQIYEIVSKNIIENVEYKTLRPKIFFFIFECINFRNLRIILTSFDL